MEDETFITDSCTHTGACSHTGGPTIFWAMETQDFRSLQCGDCQRVGVEQIEIYSPEEAKEFIRERKEADSLKNWAARVAEWICDAGSDMSWASTEEE